MYKPDQYHGGSGCLFPVTLCLLTYTAAAQNISKVLSSSVAPAPATVTATASTACRSQDWPSQHDQHEPIRFITCMYVSSIVFSKAVCTVIPGTLCTPIHHQYTPSAQEPQESPAIIDFSLSPTRQKKSSAFAEDGPTSFLRPCPKKPTRSFDCNAKDRDPSRQTSACVCDDPKKSHPHTHNGQLIKLWSLTTTKTAPQ